MVEVTKSPGPRLRGKIREFETAYAPKIREH